MLSEIVGIETVEVLAESQLLATPLFEALASVGVQVAVGGELRIVVAASQSASGLAELAEAQLADGRPWLLVSVSGLFPGIGPVFVPSQPPCLQCWRQRAWINGHSAADSNVIPIELKVIMRVAAREAASWLAGRKSRGAGKWISIDASGREQIHAVIPVCPACSLQTRRARMAIPNLKSSVTGIVSDLGAQQLAPGLFRAVGQCSQVLVPDHALRFMPEAPKLIDGKGETMVDAIRSCLGEAVERYSITFQGDERRTRGTYQDAKASAVHPHSLILASARQYDRRETARRRHGSFQWLKEPFLETEEIEWVEAIDLHQKSVQLVPAEYCFLGYGGRFANADSNGCAAGRTKWEAARNAILELIERDAVAIWWYNRLQCPRIRWQDLGSNRILGLAEILRKLKRKFWLLNVTADLGAPACVAVSHDGEGSHIALGSAAAMDWERCAWRAMIDMVVQSVEMSRSRPHSGNDGNLRDLWKWWNVSRISEHPYLLGGPPAKIDAAQSLCSPRVQFQQCAEKVQAAGCPVLLYNHTRPELKIPVIRVMAPGLRHFWARFAPGRLYDVPVKLGRLRQPLKEKKLNPIPYFL